MTLKDINPVLTHAFTLAAGILLSIFLSSEKDMSHCYIPKQWVYAFSKESLLEELNPELLGSKVQLLKYYKGKGCALEKVHPLLIQTFPFPVLSFSEKDLRMFLDEISKAKYKFRIVSKDDPDLKFCADRKLDYGYLF